MKRKGLYFGVRVNCFLDRDSSRETGRQEERGRHAAKVPGLDSNPARFGKATRSDERKL